MRLHVFFSPSLWSWWCASLAIHLTTTFVTAQNPPCYICADEGETSITLPDAIYTIPAEIQALLGGVVPEKMSCSFIERLAEGVNGIDPIKCSVLQNMVDLRDVCGCPDLLSIVSPSPTVSIAPTSRPSLSPYPTYAPSSWLDGFLEFPPIVYGNYGVDDDTYYYDDDHRSENEGEVNEGVFIIVGLFFSIAFLICVCKSEQNRESIRSESTLQNATNNNVNNRDEDPDLLKQLDPVQRREFVENMLPHMTVGTEIPVLLENCAICQESFQNGESVCRSNDIDCKHIFCRLCIVEWLLRSDRCPCCQRNFLSLDSVLDVATASPLVHSNGTGSLDVSNELIQPHRRTMQLGSEQPTPGISTTMSSSLDYGSVHSELSDFDLEEA